MDGLDALVRMRYRPSGDVLVGQVEQLGAQFGAADAGGVTDDGPTAVADEHQDRVEQLDADTSRTWRLITDGPHRGRSLLVSFHVVGAGARLRNERATLSSLLPVPLARAALEMIDSADGAAERLAVDDRVRAVAEVSMFLPWSQLLSDPADTAGRAQSSSTEPADLGATRALAASLTHLADAVHAELAELPAGRRADPGDHSDRFIEALRVLASIVSRHRLPAPGAATRAIEAVRGGLPLSGSERTLVRAALAATDGIDRWRDAARTLDVLATALDDQRAHRLGRNG
jgi:hypothetical protein